MAYGIAAAAYFLFLILILRFFRAVHHWDEEVHSMNTGEAPHHPDMSHTKAA